MTLLQIDSGCNILLLSYRTWFFKVDKNGLIHFINTKPQLINVTFDQKEKKYSVLVYALILHFCSNCYVKIIDFVPYKQLVILNHFHVQDSVIYFLSLFYYITLNEINCIDS